MPTIEERVAYLEGTVGGHTRAFGNQQHAMADIRAGLTELRIDMNQRFALIDQQISELRGAGASQFKWLVGIQLTTILTILGALIAARAI